MDSVASRGSSLVKKLGGFVALSPAEIDCLVTVQSKPRTIAAKTEIVSEGQTGHSAYILQAGWVLSYKILRGGERQIIAFSVPGDFIGLRSVLLRTSDHSFAAITDVSISSIAVPRLNQVFAAYPRLAAAFLWAVSREQAIAVEHLVGLGRRSAIERVAHFFLELRQRLFLVGLASETEFDHPINQYMLGDALGLTAIHVNRVLRQLRERGLISVVAHQHVRITDIEGLIAIAGYDPGYLDAGKNSSALPA